MTGEKLPQVISGNVIIDKKFNELNRSMINLIYRKIYYTKLKIHIFYSIKIKMFSH